MYEVFLTTRSLLDKEGMQVLDAHAIPDGMPFFVDPDTLEYPADLNAFLRQLPSQGVQSKETWKGYAYQVAVWCRFLLDQRSQPNVWRATREDAEVYFRARRVVDPKSAISAGSWNRLAICLAALYDYGIRKELTTINPFRRDRRFTLSGVKMEHDQRVVQERHSGRDSMRFHTLAEYIELRDVGFKGLLPSGDRDPNYTPRDSERNAAFAEMLVTTGMRVGEASALVRPELPRGGATQMLEMRLVGSITKNKKTRKVFLPKRVKADIDAYMLYSRQIAVARANEAGTYQGGTWVDVVAFDSEGFTLTDGTKRKWGQADPDYRKKLVEVKPDGTRDPLWLWLSTNGKPVAREAWTAVWNTAVRRCQANGLDIHSSPHKLRHTFSVHMLNFLERQKVGAFELSKSKTFSGNTLRTVQLLLGHSSMDTTTSFYLGTVDLMSDLLEGAGSQYAEQLEAGLAR